jgi:undecaprenyl pyrophosphate phosphatase UppP
LKVLGYVGYAKMRNFLKNKYDYLWLSTIVATIGIVGFGFYVSHLDLKEFFGEGILSLVLVTVIILPLGMLFAKLSERKNEGLKLKSV